MKTISSFTIILLLVIIVLELACLNAIHIKKREAVISKYTITNEHLPSSSESIMNVNEARRLTGFYSNAMTNMVINYEKPDDYIGSRIEWLFSP